jgi:outer membrane lipoprotein SlyB
MTSVSICNLEGKKILPSASELEMELLNLEDSDVIAVGGGYFGEGVGIAVGFVVGLFTAGIPGAIAGAIFGGEAGDKIGDGVDNWLNS